MKLPTEPKHGNKYYLDKIRRHHKGLFADIQAGRISINKARQLAGLGGTRTRLHELKNAWSKATPQERLDFLSFAGVGPPTALPAGAPGSAFDGDGMMLDWARRRIPEIMARRNVTFGEVADELGVKRLNPSVMNAVRNRTKIKSAATASALEAWLVRNAGV